MPDDALAQSDADTLLRMEKVPASMAAFDFPSLGGRIEVPLVSRDKREQFSLDINRKRIALTTGYQTRGRKIVVLARLDFAAPHRNPDGSEVGVPPCAATTSRGLRGASARNSGNDWRRDHFGSLQFDSKENGHD